jgi:hypothetical protein
MSQTPAFIARVTNDLKFGTTERSRLRLLAGGGLDASIDGFDLFTGLWWPLRKKNAASPRREIAWIISKLYAAFPIRHEPCERDGATTLAVILGREERRFPLGPGRERFRRHFDSLLCATLAELERHLRWALDVVRDAVVSRRSNGLDWVQLTDDLSIWDRTTKHRLGRGIREIWTEHYWKAANQM